MKNPLDVFCRLVGLIALFIVKRQDKMQIPKKLMIPVTKCSSNNNTNQGLRKYNGKYQLLNKKTKVQGFINKSSV